jgi:hypothetical protein
MESSSRLLSGPNYERAIRVVRQVVRRWDPYGLLASGCPPDEFDREIVAVVNQIPPIRSSTDAAHALSRVFSSAFDRQRFRPEDCVVAGAELYEALSSEALLAG